MRHDDGSFAVLGDFDTLKLAFDAALREAATLKYCMPTNEFDRFSQSDNNRDCGLQVERLRLRGPAIAALAFGEEISSITTTSRIPSTEELAKFLDATLKHPDDADTVVLDCA